MNAESFRLPWLRRFALRLGMLALAGVNLEAAPIKFIAVSATAVRDYARPLGDDGQPRPQTYVFTEGKFFAGRTVDRSQSRTRFTDVAEALAPQLAKQAYFPTKDAATADLLLMVHWGTTTVYEDPQKEFHAERINEALNEYRSAAAANGGDADPGALNAALNERSNGSASAQGAIARNAALLGYREVLEREQRKVFSSADEQTMNEELNEERYFVIVMAYDYAFMRREHRPRLLWVTRISVRAAGNNFTEAIPAIAEAGSPVYGHHLPGIQRVDVKRRVGQVEFGELKTLGPVEESETKETAK